MRTQLGREVEAGLDEAMASVSSSLSMASLLVSTAAQQSVAHYLRVYVAPHMTGLDWARFRLRLMAWTHGGRLTRACHVDIGHWSGCATKHDILHVLLASVDRGVRRVLTDPQLRAHLPHVPAGARVRIDRRVVEHVAELLHISEPGTCRGPHT